MKINGEWEFDEELVQNLNLAVYMEKYAEKFEPKSNKLMTAGVVDYLKRMYPNKENEYKLIYMKAEKYLQK